VDLDPARLVLKAFEREGVNVVSPSTLYRMKKDTVRAKDRADAEMLRRRFRLGGD
jgi:hypothetical protein